MEIQIDIEKASFTKLKPLLSKKKFATKSEKTRERTEEIKIEIHCYYEHIQRLYDFAKGKISLKGKGYSLQAERYRPNDEDKQRLHSTIENLRLQIALLEKELMVLVEYGA